MSNMNLVERLAEKFATAKHQNKWGATKDNSIIRFEARWWMNAIADELAARKTVASSPPDADWLHAQAKENDNDQYTKLIEP